MGIHGSTEIRSVGAWYQALFAGVCSLALFHGCASRDGATATDDKCTSVESKIAAELAKVQSCSDDGECGSSESKGTCGCTRAVAVRTGADTTVYLDLLDQRTACGIPSGGVCDCPNADGFRCINSTCEWNYVSR